MLTSEFSTIDVSLKALADPSRFEICRRLAAEELCVCHLVEDMGLGQSLLSHLGTKITKLQPVGGLSAETAAAVTLFTTAGFGFPVSTTHTITGAIIGVGTTHRFSAVRWGLTRRVFLAWILTLPGAALIAAISYC